MNETRNTENTGLQNSVNEKDSGQGSGPEKSVLVRNLNSNEWFCFGSVELAGKMLGISPARIKERLKKGMTWRTWSFSYREDRLRHFTEEEIQQNYTKVVNLLMNKLGVERGSIAQVLNLSYPSVMHKLNGQQKWSIKEMKTIADELQFNLNKALEGELYD